MRRSRSFLSCNDGLRVHNGDLGRPRQERRLFLCDDRPSVRKIVRSVIDAKDDDARRRAVAGAVELVNDAHLAPAGLRTRTAAARLARAGPTWGEISGR